MKMKNINVKMKNINELERELSLSKPYQEDLAKAEEVIKDIEEKIKVAFVAGDKAIDVLIHKDTYHSYTPIFMSAFYHIRHLNEIYSPELKAYFVHVEISWKN